MQLQAIGTVEHLFVQTGETIRTEANKPIALTHGEEVWLVLHGHIDVFAVTTEQGVIVERRRYLFSCDCGEMLFGFHAMPETRKTILLLVGRPGTELIKLPRATLLEACEDPNRRHELAIAMERWIHQLSKSLHESSSPSIEHIVLEAGQQICVLGGSKLRTVRDVVWVRSSGHPLQWLVPSGYCELPQEIYTPVSSTHLLVAEGNVECSVLETDAWMLQDQVWHGLDVYHELVYQAQQQAQQQSLTAEAQRLAHRIEEDEAFLTRAADQLRSTVKTANPTYTQAPMTGTVKNPLLEACRTIGAYLQADIQEPPAASYRQNSHTQLMAIAKASRLRVRKVILKGAWWEEDNGPLLVYMDEGRTEPAALIPRNSRSYVLIQPAEGTVERVTAEHAARVPMMAYMFYRPLPPQPLKWNDILKFGAGIRATSDLIMIVLMSLLCALLGLGMPIATGVLFDRIIPSANTGQLIQMCFVLMASSLSIFMFSVVRSYAETRLESRMDHAMESAVWDRLLSLPVTFFRRFSAGDLTLRANSINSIRKQLSGVVISTVLSGVFSLFSLILLFYFDARLAWLAFGLVLFSVLVSSVIAVWQVRVQRALTKQQGIMSSFMLQLIRGISKFRVAGAENRAFYLWSGLFSAQKKTNYRVRTIGNYFAVFYAFYPLAATILLFYAVTTWDQSAMSTGQFTAFLAAFTSLMNAMLMMSSALLSVMNMIPTYERAKVIFEAVPEVHPGSEHPGELTGAIELNHLYYRYMEGQPYVLQNVSLQIEPGQFIAVVGASGSGKSTLLRLLLGFDSAESGAIFYDGRELNTLDIEAVRSQFGVVLQQGQLMPGSIYANIAGSSQISMEEAWEAARLSGLDQDIRNMPMGMHTMVTEGASTISGGQRQRLLIARAVVRQPRILFFDEATSALDNETQALVSRSLERMQATRLVIAHRLSTIIHADRIIVLDQGRIVQTGTYAELIAQEGVFAILAHRQFA